MDKKWWALDREGRETVAVVRTCSIGWTLEEDEGDEEKELKAMRIEGWMALIPN